MKALAMWGICCLAASVAVAEPAPGSLPRPAAEALHANDPPPGPLDQPRLSKAAAKPAPAAKKAPAGHEADPGLLLLTGMAMLLFMAGRRAP